MALVTHLGIKIQGRSVLRYRWSRVRRRCFSLKRICLVIMIAGFIALLAFWPGPVSQVAEGAATKYYLGDFNSLSDVLEFTDCLRFEMHDYTLDNHLLYSVDFLGREELKGIVCNRFHVSRQNLSDPEQPVMEHDFWEIAQRKDKAPAPVQHDIVQVTAAKDGKLFDTKEGAAAQLWGSRVQAEILLPLQIGNRIVREAGLTPDDYATVKKARFTDSGKVRLGEKEVSVATYEAVENDKWGRFRVAHWSQEGKEYALLVLLHMKEKKREKLLIRILEL